MVAGKANALLDKFSLNKERENEHAIIIKKLRDRLRYGSKD